MRDLSQPSPMIRTPPRASSRASVPAGRTTLSTAVALFSTLTLLSGPVLGQEAPPQTDIYVADLSVFDGLYYLGDVRNVTNRPEVYDNQPLFTPDSRSILYTAAHDDGDDGQTEIHRYYLSSGRTTRVTRTPESEYSPTPIPGDRAISVIRVEADSTQRLWRFTMEGMDAEVVLRDVAPVGYHAWGNERSVLLFVLGDPPTLEMADATTGLSEVVADRIGRSLHKIPNRNAWSFVERVSDEESWISDLNIGTHEIGRLIQTPDGGDDHAWTPEGVLLMASAGQILHWDPEVDDDWRAMADLRHMNLTFTRLAVSPDGTKIAMVGLAHREDEP